MPWLVKVGALFFFVLVSCMQKSGVFGGELWRSIGKCVGKEWKTTNMHP